MFHEQKDLELMTSPFRQYVFQAKMHMPHILFAISLVATILGPVPILSMLIGIMTPSLNPYRLIFWSVIELFPLFVSGAYKNIPTYNRIILTWLWQALIRPRTFIMVLATIAFILIAIAVPGIYILPLAFPDWFGNLFRKMKIESVKKEREKGKEMEREKESEREKRGR